MTFKSIHVICHPKHLHTVHKFQYTIYYSLSYPLAQQVTPLLNCTQVEGAWHSRMGSTKMEAPEQICIKQNKSIKSRILALSYR